MCYPLLQNSEEPVDEYSQFYRRVVDSKYVWTVTDFGYSSWLNPPSYGAKKGYRQIGLTTRIGFE